MYSSAAWGDYDNDGRLDFLLTGATGFNCEECDNPRAFSQLWRNTGSGFSNVTASVAPGLTPVYYGSATWADYDNDGRLDFFLSGFDPVVYRGQLWRNTGSGFTNVTATVAPGLPEVYAGAATWADYDNDGRLDLFVLGYFDSQLWRNTGNGFTNVTASVAPGLPRVAYSSMAWGDYDNDGRSDFLIMGSTYRHCDGCDGYGELSQLWRNNIPQTNPPPAVITGLPSSASQASVTLNAQINPHSRAANAWFVWGDSTNYGQMTSEQPMGNGNSFTNFSKTIPGLSTGMTYYYRAVGSNDQGQVVLGAEQHVALAPPVVTTSPAGDLTPTSATINGHVNPNNLSTYGWFEWGATPAYGQVTPVHFLGNGFDANLSQYLSGLAVGTTYYFRAVASNSLGVAYGAAQSSLVTPTFANVTATAAPGLPLAARGSVAWGDYDSDGRLDFLLTGYFYDEQRNDDIFVSQLWQNTGSGFAEVTAAVAPGLPQVWLSSVAWGDYDNDGRLDLLLTGNYGGFAISQVWRNTGSGFTNVTATVAPGLPQVGFSSVAWGDYDNDGRLDFLLTGTFDTQDGDNFISQLWRNTGTGFTNVTATVAPGLPQVGYSSVAWGDYDNDGRLDFLITGYSLDGFISQIWRNTQTGFTNVTATVAPDLPGVRFSSVAWGDYDNDGQLDFLLTGTPNDLTTISQLWRNTGSGFTNVTATVAPGLPGGDFSSVAWGDYDNDGRLDFFLTGVGLTQLWRNTGSGFTNVTASVAPALAGVQFASMAWGDYDNDGRLDFLLTGYDNDYNYISQIWRNFTQLTNTPPSAPTGLAMTATTNAVMLSWNSATDGQTPARGLTYNVRAGTTPGGNDLVSAHVTATNGFRRVPAMGNSLLRHSLPLTGLTNGQAVYWSVQAVDTSFAGGPFATETSIVSIPQLTITPLSSTNAIVSWSPATFGWILQQSTNLSIPNWSATPSGSANPATVPATNEARFYRLANP
jgi:hypothetical protein